MDYLKILRENPDLADEFDSLFDFFLLDGLSPREDCRGTMHFFPARQGVCQRWLLAENTDLLEDGSIGYYSSEGEAAFGREHGRSFSLLVNCICWHVLL